MDTELSRQPLVWLVVVASASLALAGPSPLRTDSDQLKQKIAAISARGSTPAGSVFRTMLTEREVNAYLAFEAAPSLPQGIVDPSISILAGNRVTGRAVVDLDRVRQERNPVSLLDPVRYLRGRLMVKATGVVRATDGLARFELEAADVAGVPIPKLLLQQIVSYYSRSPQRPSGISLDDPLALPAGIRALEIDTGRAVVVQ
jgi:hypothetical protein